MAFCDFLLTFGPVSGAQPPVRFGEDRAVEAFRAGNARLVMSVAKGEGASMYAHCRAARFECWLFGEVYGYKNDGQASPHPIQRFAQDLDAGRFDPAVLNGHCLLLAYDRCARNWHVWTDRFATLHAYYTCNGRAAALGTWAPAVARAASAQRLDWVGLAGFFAFGFFPGDRTHFEDARILQPATHYVLDGAGHVAGQERYWHWRHEPEQAMAYDDAVAEFGRRLEEVIGEQVAWGRVALPISGGLDSRCTVAALPGSTGRLWSYSYGYSTNSVETSIAAQVAAARGLAFESFTIAPYLFDRLDEVLACVEGFQDLTQCRQAYVSDDLRRHADAVIAAHWGDVWLDDMGLVDRSPSELTGEAIVAHVLGRMVKRGRKWLLAELCRPQLGLEEPEELLRDMVRAEMDALAQIEDPDFRVKAFKTDQWSARWTTASLRAYQAAAFPRLPFYDTRLADLFCTVPSRYVRKRQLQVDYLKRFAPDLARVTWQVYDSNLYHYQHSHTWLLPKRAVKKAWRMLTGRRVVERNWEVQLLSAEGRRGLVQWLLRPGLRLHDLLAPKTIRELLGAFFASPSLAGRGYTVSMLLTFSAWLERYG